MFERLFFALWPPPTLREQLVALRRPLAHGLGRGSWGASAAGTEAIPAGDESPAVRLSHPRDLHLTLVFVGAVEAHLRPCVEAAGDDIACRAFELTLDQTGSWARQRVWVAEPRQAPGALFGLVGQLQQNLLVCGLEPEKRRYRPHVTLARKAPPIEMSAVSLRWPVTELVLAASRSGRRPSYAIVRRWSLDG